MRTGSTDLLGRFREMECRPGPDPSPPGAWTLGDWRCDTYGHYHS